MNFWVVFLSLQFHNINAKHIYIYIFIFICRALNDQMVVNNEVEGIWKGSNLKCFPINFLERVMTSTKSLSQDSQSSD
jgi:hypothetical protein